MGRKLIDDDKLIEMMKARKTQKAAAKYFGVSEAAVSKRLKRLTPLPESFENLSDKEKKFALDIAGGKSQTQAAFDSFEVSSRASAKALGHQMMKKPNREVKHGKGDSDLLFEKRQYEADGRDYSQGDE